MSKPSDTCNQRPKRSKPQPTESDHSGVPNFPQDCVLDDPSNHFFSRCNCCTLANSSFAGECPTATRSRISTTGSAAGIKIFPDARALRSSRSCQDDLRFKMSIPDASAARVGRWERIVGKGMEDGGLHRSCMKPVHLA